MFQSKLLDTLKIYIVSSISLNLVDIKLFGGCKYVKMVNIMLPLHGLAFEVICYLYRFFFKLKNLFKNMLGQIS